MSSNPQHDDRSTTAVAVLEPSPPLPATVPARGLVEQRFTEEQIHLIKEQICAGASDDEIALFLAHCKRLRLDPFTGQIWAVRRWSRAHGKKMLQPQTGIDGFRLVAERSDKYAGQGDIEWCGPNGVWHDIWVGSKPPSGARAAVYRHDWGDRPLRAVARYESYVPRDRDGRVSDTWHKMPDVMLAKCAEALALRRAFPNDLSGIYTADEMAQAEAEEERRGGGQDAAPREQPRQAAAGNGAPSDRPAGKDIHRVRKFLRAARSFPEIALALATAREHGVDPVGREAGVLGKDLQGAAQRARQSLRNGIAMCDSKNEWHAVAQAFDAAPAWAREELGDKHRKLAARFGAAANEEDTCPPQDDEEMQALVNSEPPCA